MDHNKDDLLQKSEVDGILTHVPHEECLFGFIISSDTNKDHVLDRTEWEEGFAHVGEYNQLEWKQRGRAVRALAASWTFCPWGPFLESPGNFSGPKSNIQIEI